METTLTAGVAKHLAGSLTREEGAHERHKELVERQLAIGNQLASPPEPQCENEILDGLGEREPEHHVHERKHRLLNGVVEPCGVSIQRLFLNSQTGNGANGRDRLGSNGGASREAMRIGAVHVGFESNPRITGSQHGRQASKDTHKAQLPRYDNSQDGGTENVEDADQNEAHVVTHQLQDGLRVRVESTGQRTSRILRSVEELDVLAEDILKHGLAKLAVHLLGHHVCEPSHGEINHQGGESEHKQHQCEKVAPSLHCHGFQLKHIQDLGENDSLGRENGS